MRDRQYFKSLLAKKAAVVTFVKKDKSVRDMLCTLEASRVPETGGVAYAEENPDNVVVFDLEKKAWRCFNVRNVINVAEVK